MQPPATTNPPLLSSSPPPPPPPSKPDNRRVSFARKVHVKRTTPLSQYTPEEIEAAWYTSDEYNNIAKKARKIINRMYGRRTPTERMMAFSTHKVCTRGLEAFGGERAQQKRERRERAYRIVLGQAEAQGTGRASHEEERNAISIASEYRKVSVSCEVEARIRGRQDQENARSYLASASTVASSGTSNRRGRSGGDSSRTEIRKRMDGRCISSQSLSPLPTKRNTLALSIARAA
mmetsp:Transcript_472/g.1109  ORF Transcript_472/g.1109 Transcript_472/m.1109 type:complete len:234 (-) Transcript_472:35-736(-)